MKTYTYGGLPGKTKHAFCCCAFCLKGDPVSLCGWNSRGEPVEVDDSTDCDGCAERAIDGGHFLQ